MTDERPHATSTYLSQILAAAGDQVDPTAVSRLLDDLAGLVDQMDQLVQAKAALEEVLANPPKPT